jgi:hypothetical protein
MMVAQTPLVASARSFQTPSTTLVTAPLLRKNDLVYLAAPPPSVPPIDHSRIHSVVTAELWHQRLGHPCLTQLDALAKHSIGVPPNLVSQSHPFRHCQVCSDARPTRSPMGITVSTDHLHPGSRFDIDFGFMRASSENFIVDKTTPRVVTSIDGYNAYLLICDAATHYTWVFPTISKAPPILIIEALLHQKGATPGLHYIRMDQGGNLWRSSKLCDVIATSGYIIEPTGSDSANQNGKVERLNGTFGVMVRALLYSAGLRVVSFWSRALLHAVYLKNRLYHRAIHCTSYQAWTGNLPNLTSLHIFGSLVTSRTPGTSPAKLDKHATHGIFLVAMVLLHKIHNWRSRLCHAYTLSISSRPVFTLQDICQAVVQACQLSLPTCVITFTFDDVVNTLTHAGLTQIYFDQLHVMQGHIDQAKRAAVNHININAPCLRRNDLLSSPSTWPVWQDAEFLQLDNYHAQGMFGDPILPPSASAIFHWIWIYSIKTQENNRKKDRAVCDGSTRGGAAHVTGHTYAATPAMIDFRLQLAISALRGYTVYHSDVSNAFAEAGHPEQHFMQVDAAFRNWWNSRFPASPLMPGQAIPILRNLQGHPEAPPQWSIHIDGILCEDLQFTPPTHAP